MFIVLICVSSLFTRMPGMCPALQQAGNNKCVLTKENFAFVFNEQKP